MPNLGHLFADVPVVSVDQDDSFKPILQDVQSKYFGCSDTATGNRNLLNEHANPKAAPVQRNWLGGRYFGEDSGRQCRKTFRNGQTIIHPCSL